MSCGLSLSAETPASSARRLILGAANLLREARWITRPRVMYCGVLLAAVSTIFLALATISHTKNGLVADNGEQLGIDFVAIYAAEKTAASGQASRVYDKPWLSAQQDAITGPGALRRFPFPPVALLLWLPLALFSFIGALVTWTVAGAIAFFAVLRRLIGNRAAAIAALGTPAAFFNIYSGQNGYLTAVLLGGGLMTLTGRPVLAGICFGCLAYKPQMAVLVPVALVASGRWRSFAAAAVTAGVLTVASFLLFGAATWDAFLGERATELQFLADATFSHRMPTVFIASRELGAPVGLAFGVQAVSSLLALAAVIAAWRSPAALDVKAAILVVATFLATPHAWDYDEIVLIFAAAWLWRDALRTGFLAWERLAVVALLVLPLPSIMFNILTHVEPGPIVLWLALLALVVRAGCSKNPELRARRAVA
jgi:hypothetical protein